MPVFVRGARPGGAQDQEHDVRFLQRRLNHPAEILTGTNMIDVFEDARSGEGRHEPVKNPPRLIGTVAATIGHEDSAHEVLSATFGDQRSQASHLALIGL
jgi:hypothetical protein